MEIAMRNSGLEMFKGFLNLVKTVLSEDMSMEIQEDGLHVIGMDPSHVAMIRATAKRELFDRFEVEEKEEPVTFNVTEFMKFMDRMQKDEDVTISVERNEARISIRGKKAGWKRQFRVPLLEPLEVEVPQPRLVLKSSTRILTNSIDRAVKDAGLVAEHFHLKFTTEQIVISATGELGESHNEWAKDSDEILELKADKEEQTATFTLSYFRDMITALKPICDMLTIQLATDMPFEMTMHPKTPNIEATLWLAPCIG